MVHAEARMPGVAVRSPAARVGSRTGVARPHADEPVTKYWTESGSVYQVDEDRRRVRQLMVVPGGSPHTLSDGEWREYERLTGGLPGDRALFWWPDGKPHDFTMTTRVLRVEPLS